MSLTIEARISQLTKTDADWLAIDPVLLDGEWAVIKTLYGAIYKYQVKVGDGVHKYSQITTGIGGLGVSLEEVTSMLLNYVPAVAGKGLSANDFTNQDVLDLGNKVDKIAGKGLSANDFTTEYVYALINKADYYNGGYVPVYAADNNTGNIDFAMYGNIVADYGKLMDRSGYAFTTEQRLANYATIASVLLKADKISIPDNVVPVADNDQLVSSGIQFRTLMNGDYGIGLEGSYVDNIQIGDGVTNLFGSSAGITLGASVEMFGTVNLPETGSIGRWSFGDMLPTLDTVADILVGNAMVGSAFHANTADSANTAYTAGQATNADHATYADNVYSGGNIGGVSTDQISWINDQIQGLIYGYVSANNSYHSDHASVADYAYSIYGGNFDLTDHVNTTNVLQTPDQVPGPPQNVFVEIGGFMFKMGKTSFKTWLNG